MQKLRQPLRLFVLSLGVALIAACTTTPAAGPLPGSPTQSVSSLEQTSFSQPDALFRTPALIAVNLKTDKLESWPVSPVGGNDPTPFTASLKLAARAA